MTFKHIKEQLEEFLIANCDDVAITKDPADKWIYYQQAFGAVRFVTYQLAQNSQEMREIENLWENDWRPEFEKILSQTP